MTRLYCVVDPGHRETGWILRQADQLHAHDVTVRRDDKPFPDGPYVRAVAASIIDGLAAVGVAHRDPNLTVAVEGVAYWPGKQARNLTGLLGTAIVLGSILDRWPDATVIPPGNAPGTYHDGAYPPPLRRPPGGKGHDRLRHCRSAWDLSFQVPAVTAAGR